MISRRRILEGCLHDCMYVILNSHTLLGTSVERGFVSSSYHSHSRNHSDRGETVALLDV